MPHRLDIANPALEALARNPREVIEGKLNGSRYRARIAIPGYGDIVASHFAGACGDGLDQVCRRSDIPFNFQDFGLIFEFDRPVELAIHDAELTLDENLRRIVGRFGPVIVRNAYLPADSRREAQRNIFANLNFHFDRGSNQSSQYSLFFRDPFDAVQAQPRTSSTLFVANIVAHLQYAREHRCRPEDQRWRTRYEIFHDEALDALIDRIVLEHPWDEPEGTGEISLLHNRTVLHASYYRHETAKGYPISVRYLR